MKCKASLKKFLFENTPISKILEVSEHKDWRTGKTVTEVIGSCSGDSCHYRIVGDTPKEYKLYER